MNDSTKINLEFHWNKIHRPVKYFYILRLIRGSTLRDVSFSKHLVAMFPRHITTGKKGERYWPSIELKLFSFLRCSIPTFIISVGSKHFSPYVNTFAVRTQNRSGNTGQPLRRSSTGISGVKIALSLIQ